MLILAALSLVLWLLLLVAPWQAWRCREQLEPESAASVATSDFTVLIPARNEAAYVAETLACVRVCAPAAPVVLVDDESSDGTADVGQAVGMTNLVLVRGVPPPDGWSGKLWALEQGLAEVRTPWVLLLDADIRLEPGMITALQRQAARGYALVSVLAEPCWQGWAARWLLPAFVYFFKLLYPFSLVNKTGRRMAAAAGGVILIEHRVLADIGGFSAWRGAIIDDCTLAAHVKRAGHRCFLGLTHGARSLRQQNAASIASMIARSAYVQLRESPLVLLTASVLLVLAYWIPPAALAFGGVTRWLGLAALVALIVSYLPVLAYYRRSRLAALFLPIAATGFLVVTWYSALRAWLGTRSVWKSRRYPGNIG